MVQKSILYYNYQTNPIRYDVEFILGDNFVVNYLIYSVEFDPLMRMYLLSSSLL